MGLLDYKIQALYELKAFANNSSYLTQIIQLFLKRIQNMGKMRKFWSPVFPLFLKMINVFKRFPAQGH